MRIIRVFPRRTSFTPTDDMAFIGDPPMIRPEADEIHISVTFTWDLPKAYRLYEAWAQYYDTVKIGGPPISRDISSSTPGMYIKSSAIFTSRGCNNNCSWCLVPLYEGKFRSVPYELVKNPVIQDNNILLHEPAHLGKIMRQLETAGSVTFAGGLDSSLIDDRVAYMLSRIHINQLFLACDTKTRLLPLEKAIVKLNGLGRNKTRCYVMIGYSGETIEEAKERLQAVWDVGAMPFAQLYQPPDKYIKYSYAWRNLARNWSRPAIMKTVNRGNNV